MKAKFFKMLMSRTFWTIVVLFVVSGVEGVRQFFPVELLPYVQGVLGLLTVWFKMSPSQDY